MERSESRHSGFAHARSGMTNVNEVRMRMQMTGAETLDVARDAIWTIVVVSSPLMVVGLVVGVVVSLFQALTQIQEQTLVFVPKILAIFVTLLLALPFMADALHSHMMRISSRNHRRLRHYAWIMRIDISLLPALAATFMLVFARVGAMVMLLPGLGESNIPVRIKLAIALLLTLIILPLHRAAYHVDMQSLTPLLVLMVHEIIDRHRARRHRAGDARRRCRSRAR